MGYHDHEISVSIVGDRTIRRLNREYLGKDRPTNVLSFSMLEGEGVPVGSRLLGDVIISADTAAREADGEGASLQDRLMFLLLHGALHLCGYDHERSGDEEARRMEVKERELWEMLEKGG